MSTSKILCTRQLLGSMATTAMSGFHSIRWSMSYKSSATYRLVHIVGGSDATRKGIEELESAEAKQRKLEQWRLKKPQNMEVLNTFQKQLAKLVHLVEELESKDLTEEKYENLLKEVIKEQNT